MICNQLSSSGSQTHAKKKRHVFGSTDDFDFAGELLVRSSIKDDEIFIHPMIRLFCTVLMLNLKLENSFGENFRRNATSEYH